METHFVVRKIWMINISNDIIFNKIINNINTDCYI